MTPKIIRLNKTGGGFMVDDDFHKIYPMNLEGYMTSCENRLCLMRRTAHSAVLSPLFGFFFSSIVFVASCVQVIHSTLFTKADIIQYTIIP